MSISVISNFDLLPTELIAEIISHVMTQQFDIQKIFQINKKFSLIYNNVLCTIGIPIIVSQQQILRHINTHPNLIEGYFIIYGMVQKVTRNTLSKNENHGYDIKISYLTPTTTQVVNGCASFCDFLCSLSYETRYYPNTKLYYNSKYIFVPGPQTIVDILKQHHLSNKSQFLKKSLFVTLNYYSNFISADMSVQQHAKLKIIDQLKENFELCASLINHGQDDPIH
jgi:hypothetical protein